MDADPVELRVLGCLLEKQRTTPDQYPLSLNALRLACNQTTNREPIVSYDEGEIHEALQRLARRGWSRLASGAGSRAAKYRQLFDEALGLGGDEVAILCVLMLRGPQTPGELNQRTGRLHAFSGIDAIHATLDGLAARGLVERLERRPGQKEERYRHLLGVDQQESDAQHSPTSTRSDELGSSAAPAGLEARVAALEGEVARLREALSTLARADAGPT
ncbi:MAG TPA: YceH family protein [Gaiella sp.]